MERADHVLDRLEQYIQELFQQERESIYDNYAESIELKYRVRYNYKNRLRTKVFKPTGKGNLLVQIKTELKEITDQENVPFEVLDIKGNEIYKWNIH